jgi:carbon storage regulator
MARTQGAKACPHHYRRLDGRAAVGPKVGPQYRAMACPPLFTDAEEEDMLVLTRKVGEGIVIGDAVRLVVVSMEGGQCRLGIVAPRHVPVHRQEVYEKVRAGRGDPSRLTFSGQAGDNPIATELRAANAGTCVRDLVLDFTNVRQINSLELGTLVELHKRLATLGACLKLIRLDANVRSVFAVTRLDTFLTITDGP